MAQETLGEWGGTLATVTYVFLGYTSMVAYSAKSGEILYHLVHLPESVSGFFFTILFTVLISVGGTQATDQVNQWLTASMIVLCAYLGGDLQRIRASVLLGSVVPLLALLVWDAIALGLSTHADQVADPVELLASMRWGGVSFMVEAFSLLAVGTSLIGTLLGFSEFFKEQLNSLSWHSPSIQGGYCMTMLYGVLPPAMAWAMHNRQCEEEGQETDHKAIISRAWPALLGVGLFACGIVVEQILQDLSMLHS
ncbi:hypothetical protein Acr_03g0013240 [Actinidia rufa]|uniref:Tryptophan/tyrosine permease n=1 Tax=Actinidia rufa TaxID=165716 RepID=A0A7J0EDV5_9ERIC|nr:hypothetical protein Acr_03g0013240 [Actinidia rufa]